MGHYKSNVRDLEFNLFEVLGRGAVLGQGPYADVDEDTAREMIHEVARLAENELAESLLDSDRNPPVYDPATHEVAMPASFKKSYAAYVESGFWNVDVPAALDGTVVPPSFKWALNEMILGANPAVGMYAATYSFAKLLHLFGTDEQQKLAKLMVERRDDGPDRAGRGLRRRRRPDQGRPERRRHVVDHRGQALHHLGRARPVRQHHPLRARPPRGRRPGHQGPLPLHRPEVPRRPRDR